MIITIENIAKILITIYIVGALGLSGYNMFLEIRFRNRNKISYKNYKEYRNLYLLKIDLFNIVSISLVMLFSLIIIVLFAFSRVVVWYIMVAGPVLFMMGCCLYLELTRNKYNNEKILMFDDYYYNINEIENSKSRLINKINQLETQYNSSTNSLLNSLNKYNRFFPNDAKMQEFASLFNDHKKEFIQNVTDLNNYNYSIIQHFNDNINEYLAMGIEPNFDIQEFEQIDIKRIHQFVIEISNKIKSYVADTFINNVNISAPTKAEALIELIELVEDLEYVFSLENILAIINVARSTVTNREVFFEYILSRKIVDPFSILNHCIEKDWSWCFTSYVFNGIKKTELIEFYQKIIEFNSINCCTVFLKESHIDQINVLDKVLSSTTANNNCVQLIKFERIMQNNSMEFDDISNSYENMAYSLYQANLKKKQTLLYRTIVQICKESSFLANAQYIQTEYNKAKEELKKKYKILPQLLIYFYDDKDTNSEIIDISKVISLYIEGIKTVNESTIRYLNLLLGALLLIKNKNQDCYNVVYNSLSTYKLTQTLITPFNVKNACINGRNIIKFMVDSRKKEMISIINRIENKRLAFDEFIKM